MYRKGKSLEGSAYVKYGDGVAIAIEGGRGGYGGKQYQEAGCRARQDDGDGDDQSEQ